MDEQRMWIKSRRRKRLRLLAVTLVFCLLFTTYPNILETLSVFAAETQSGDGTMYVTGFAGLPEEVREQTVPVGTGVEELTLPDTLEAVIAISEGEALPEDAEEETEVPPEGTGEETEFPETEGTETEESADNTQPEEETDGENAVPDNEGSQTEESQSTEPEDSEEAGDAESEEGKDTEPEGTAAETVATEEAAIPENSDNAGGSGESAPSVQAEDAKLTQETHTVTMPEYQAGNVITVETIENTQETGTKEETITIEGITWQSESEFDGNTEGIYIFTAVLPEGYALMEGVSLPQITVTVQADSADSVIQTLLDRIAALPDSEAYLAKEPDIESEEAYAEWMEGLHRYAGEALDIQEAYEALTKEQQALVSEEALAKLMAWVEIAEETVLSSAEVLADHSHPACGASCSHSGTHGSLSWQPFNSTGGTLGSGNYYLTGEASLQTQLTIPSGAKVNLCLNGNTLSCKESSDSIILNGELTVCDCSNGGTGVLNCGGKSGQEQAVNMNGGVLNLYGGKLTGNNPYSIIYVHDGGTANLFGGMVEGGSTCSIDNGTNGTVIISGNAVVSGGEGSQCAVRNNSTTAVLTVKDNASLSSEGHGVRSWGTVNIEGGTITSTKTDGYGIDNQEGALNITSGTITGNKYGVWMDSDASMKLSGSPAISGATADLYLQTAKSTILNNAKVNAAGYTGNALSVTESSTSGREGAYAIKVSEGSKDKFTLTNEGWVYAYKDGGLMIHSHDYTYTASGATVTETCANGCTHSATATLVLDSTVNLTYTGGAIKPVIIKYSDNWTGKGSNKPDVSAIVYNNNTGAGTNTAAASLKISNETANLNFTIAPKSLTDNMIILASGPFSYTGSEIKPAVTVKDGGITLVSGTDYTVSYSNNKTVGTTATVTVKGKGNYTGTIDKTFEITAADISGATVTLSSTTLIYNGSAQTKGVDSVTVDGRTLTEGADYTVSGNTETVAGTHKITITGINGYVGSVKEVTYTIAPKSLTGSTVTVASGPYYYNGSGITPAVTVKDGGRTVASSNYDVSYSNNINPGTATVTVTGTGNYTGTLSETFTIEYGQLPSGSLTNYVTISPSPTDDWYGFDIILTPKDGCSVGEIPAATGGVTISQETGTGAKIIYIKDADGNIYQTEFSYKLDKARPVVNLAKMTVENGNKGLWNWIIGKKSMIIKIPVSDVTDVLSGVAEVTYTAQPDNGTAQSGTPKKQDGYYQIALNAQFSGTIQLTVKDNAGNTTNVSLTADSGKVIAEDYLPVVTFAEPDTPTPNAGGWYNTTVTITVTVTDNKDSGSADILSGGIAEISWKDGESGTVQTVTGLPGNSPVCEKEFTISVNTDGTHTYYVNAVDNAGNESGWQSITVKVDTGKPVFTGNPTAKNPTEGGADITFTSSESGKVYWIVSDGETTPTAQEVKEQGEQNGGVQDIAGGTEGSFTIIGLSAGEKHTVYVVLEDAAGNLSEVKTESFLTLQKAPNITPEQVRVDYIHETITLLGIGTVEVYTDPQHPENSKITPNADGSLPVTPGTAVYIRYPEKTENGMTVPASDRAEIQIPDRPDKPAAKQVTVTDTTAAVTNSVSGEEYTLVEKGHTPSQSDWSKANTTGKFDGLNPNQEYDLYVRKKATENSFASDPVKTEIRTNVTIKEPVIAGDGKGKSSNTAPKPNTPNADGTVTFTGTYSEEYTPVIRIGSQEYTPEMTWDENSGKGNWKYTYPIPAGAAEAAITVEFRKRALTGVAVTPDALTIYADDAANESLDTLTAYVKANSSARAVYDNKTSGTVQAAYATTGSFAQKGAAYTYTASAEGKTDYITLTVSPVSASVAAPDKYMQVQKSGGYTAAEVAAWLRPQVKVTYTGDGYTARTENRTVTWNTASIDPDFGAALGEKTITGTVDLPAWTAGGNSVSMVIEFVDKIVLRDDQIQLTVPDFSYGAQTLPNPQGSITVADTNPVYTYRYSTDGGSTWVAADRLPKSGGGYIIPGSYRVEMTYRGDSYTGGKTVSFTVAEKELTILPGTLEAESRNDDGTKDASLKEGGKPVLSGAAAGDDVTLGGSLSAVFAEAGPKKNIPVTVTGFTLEGRDAGCYKLKNTTLTLYATINNADGTPPSDGNGSSGNSGGNGGGNGGEISGEDGSNGNGGGNSGGDSNSEDGSNTQENNNGSGTSAATRKSAATQPPVTSSAAGKQPTPGAGTGPGRNGGTQPDGTNNPDNGVAAGNTDPLKPGAEPNGTGTQEQDSADSEQTKEEATQTLQVSIDSGKLTITGDLVTTGNITEASETTTILEAGDGAVIVMVVCEDEQYTAGVSDTVAVANAVLTPEQIELVNDGETIEIRVDVKDISETVSGQDKEVIESGLVECRKEMPGLTLGMYVDISLFVKVGEGGWDAVTHTEEPIDVVVGIPEELKGDGREFSIIRSHDGEYTLLPDTDDDPDTITVSTDLFSAYAIAYEQADKVEASAPGESSTKCGLCHICPTFLGICYFIWLAVIVAIFLIIEVVIWRKKRMKNSKSNKA